MCSSVDALGVLFDECGLHKVVRCALRVVCCLLIAVRCSCLRCVVWPWLFYV